MLHTRLVCASMLGMITLALALPGWTAGQDQPAQPAPQPQKSQSDAPSPTFDQKAVAFGADEAENTKKLNELAAEGWEYVGPLGDRMVMFKRTLANVADHHRNGSFRIVSVASGKVLDIADGSVEGGAKLVQNAYAGADSQHWRLIRVDGHYRLINRKSGKALDVPEASADFGIQLIQWDYHGAANQQWLLEKNGKGFRIRSAGNGLVLDVEQASKEDGARVLQWGFHGEDNQLWELVLVKAK